MSDLLVFSANPDSLLLESAAHFSVTLRHYSPKPWNNYVNGKLVEGVKFLSQQIEPVVMWVDGYDSLILKSEADILSRWQSLGFPLIMSAERNCFPDAERASEFPERGLMPRFPCSGAFMGTRADVLTAMHTAIQYAGNNGDDQRAWTSAILSGAVGMQLDHGRVLFQSMGDGDPYGDACVAHFNGRVPGRGDLWKGLLNERATSA